MVAMRETRTPPEVVVHDGLENCPYLPDRLSRLPMRYPLRALSRSEMDERLAAGDRRQGSFLYRTACPGCQACQPLRVPIATFRPNRTQRRVWRNGESLFRVEIGEPTVDPRRVELYNLHKRQRNLARGESSIDEAGYSAFLVDSCCETIELCYFIGTELIGVATADVGRTSMSAVYCFFDPAYSRHSPGVYSVLHEIDLCRKWRLQYLYLGFYIAGPTRMAYKANYRSHELFIDGRWELQDSG